MVCLFVLGCAILSSLGVWQLQRGEAKRQRHEDYTHRLSQAPVVFDDLGLDDSDRFTWRRARLGGHYLGKHVLLDNRVHAGRAGYEVLSVFRTDGGRSVLVNRGWTATGPSRARAPEVLAPADPFEIAGTIGEVPVVGVRLNDAASDAEWLSPNVLRVQRIEIEALGALVDERLSPAVIYLDAGAPGALAIDWLPPGDGSARHQAYAVQWFAMAIVLGLIGLWNWRAGRRRPA